MRPLALALVLALLAPVALAAEERGIALPLPRAEDVGRYEIEEADGETRSLRFLWSAAEFPDAWGRPFRGAEVRYDGGSTCELGVDSPTGDVSTRAGGELAAFARYGDAVAPIAAGAPRSCFSGVLIDPEAPVAGSEAVIITRYGGWPETACLLRHALQGRSLAPGDTVELCAPWGMWSAVAVEMIEGHRALRLEREAEEGPQRLWLAHGLAYPLAVEWKVDEGTRTYRLAAFAPGEEPLPFDAAPATPAVTLPPLDPLVGPDDADAGLPLRLSDAARAALADPTLLELRAVLAREGAALAGAVMHARSPGPAAAPVATWTLRYAAQGASALVTCEGASASVPAVRCVAGRSLTAGAPAPGEPPADFVAPARGAGFALARERWLAVDAAASDAPLLRAEYRAWSDELGPAFVAVGTTAQGASSTPGARSESTLALSLPTGATSEMAAREASPVYVENLPAGLPPPAPLAQAPPPPREVDLPLVAGGVAASIALVAFAILAVKAGLLGFFTRLARPRILDQQTRAAVHALVEATPGIHAARIAEELARRQNVVDHHLDILVREGYLARVDIAGFRRYFVAGRYPPHEMRAMATLAEGQARRLFSLIEESPGIHLGALAQRAGISEAYASRAVKRLEAAGLVRKVRVGKTVELHPSRAAPAPAASA